MNNEQTEVLKRLVPIEELKTKYGEEVVNAKIQEVEKQLGGKVTELDENLFTENLLPEEVNNREVVSITALTTFLYLSEGLVLALIEEQNNKTNKHIPRELRQRLNNLFANNRVVLDYFQKKYTWNTVEYQNKLATVVERITTMFVASKEEDWNKCLEDYLSYLENKYINKNGSETNIS